MDVPTIIDTIIESKLLDDEGLAYISDIKQNIEPATQKLLFLQKLLTLPEYIICLFEQSLRHTNQDELVQKILEMQRQNKGKGHRKFEYEMKALYPYR